MTPDRLRSLLQEFKDGKMNLEEVLDFLKKLPYEDLAFARVDHHRSLRRGFPRWCTGREKPPGRLSTLFKPCNDSAATSW